jgi:glutathione S-transferase
MKLYVGNKNYSSWSMRPWVLMRQAGIEFDEVFVRFDSFAPDSTFKRQLAGISPTGRVPVLEVMIDGDRQRIWDSLAIAEYLAERFPERGLWPEGSAARALARCVTAEMHSSFQGLRSSFPMNIEARLAEVGARMLLEQPQASADLARIGQIWKDCLDASGGPFLFGTFGIPDAFFAPAVMRIRSYGLPLDPVCAGYADRVVQAPGVAAWITGALAEHDFRPFEEPYRSAPDARGAQGHAPCPSRY